AARIADLERFRQRLAGQLDSEHIGGYVDLERLPDTGAERQTRSSGRAEARRSLRHPVKEDAAHPRERDDAGRDAKLPLVRIAWPAGAERAVRDGAHEDAAVGVVVEEPELDPQREIVVLLVRTQPAARFVDLQHTALDGHGRVVLDSPVAQPAV